MTISKFYSLFPTELSCRKYVQQSREAQGLTCKKCSCTRHYWLAGKDQWQCNNCNFRTTLLSGTLFESSKLKLHIWFQALYLVSNTKKGISACELQRQLGLKRYEPAWFMMQKIRQAMAQINENQLLSGEIEMDDAFFTTFQDPKNQDEHLIFDASKKHNPEKIKQKVYVMVESIAMPTETILGKSGKIRILKTRPLGTDTIWHLDNGNHANNTKMSKNKKRNFRILEPKLNETNIIVSKKVSKVTPWVNTAISNSKRIIYGIYHHISSKFAQLYFDEFCFKFNFRSHKAKWNIVFLEALKIDW